MGGQKPHLLDRDRNNLGAETRVTYAPSTEVLPRRTSDGTALDHRLPFPVHVVERVETYDHISRNRFVTRYAYHHGYFDGDEREFRGFGMVEQWDTEQFSSGVDPEWHVPPVHTKTWFHTGAERSGNEDEFFDEPGLTIAQARERRLPNQLPPAGLTAEERREARRALKGTMLRQEVYAADESANAAIPYTVVEQTFTVRRLQARGRQRHAVFLTHPDQTLSHQYERDPTDPRTTHTLTIEVDNFGNVLQQCTIAYGRRRADPALTETADRDTQARTLVTYVDSQVTTAIDEPSAYRTPLPAQTRTYELTN